MMAKRKLKENSSKVYRAKKVNTNKTERLATCSGPPGYSKHRKVRNKMSAESRRRNRT